MAQKLDIILFGATGFTGEHAVPAMAKLAKRKNRRVTWGVAGRSEKKLKDLLSDCEKEAGCSLEKIPIIIADVQQQNTINSMARQARIIINCCGPFSFFGEAVVKACIEEGTHHVDVSAEILYMEEMQLKYHKLAQEKGVYIISACGYASIPVDLGIVFMQQKFQGTLNSVVAYLSYWEEGESEPSPIFNRATWDSMIYVLTHGTELKKIRQQLFPTELPNFKPKLHLKVLPHKTKLVDGWAFPFETTDSAVVKRSQREFYEKKSKRPVQLETYFTVKTLMQVIWVMIYGIIATILTKFDAGIKLVLKYPERFSGGIVGSERPSKERVEKGRFSMTLYGEGWRETLSNPNDQFVTRPNKSMTAKVQGRNPAYGAASVILLLSGITVITETDKMPPGGGVYAPGYAFADTSLAEQLNENDVTFEILTERALFTSK